MNELEKLLAEATPSGDWSVDENTVWSNGRGVPIADVRIGAPIWYKGPKLPYQANAALIVAAVNALPELLAAKAERDRAQRACEQMGARITYLENSLREIGAAIINGATDTLWMGDQISDETIVDFICNLTGDDPSLLGTFARAALNQETKP